MGAEDGEVYNCTSSKVTSGSIGGRSESKNRGGESRDKELHTSSKDIIGQKHI